MPRVNWILMPSLAWAAGLVSWPGVYDGLAGTAEIRKDLNPGISSGA